MQDQIELYYFLQGLFENFSFLFVDKEGFNMYYYKEELIISYKVFFSQIVFNYCKIFFRRILFYLLVCKGGRYQYYVVEMVLMRFVFRNLKYCLDNQFYYIK